MGGNELLKEVANSKHKTKKKLVPSETDLYAPVRDLFTNRGYTVRGEVAGCDLTALRDEELVVVELKTAFNTALLIQATDRQRAADAVYVALPMPDTSLHSTRWTGILHLLKRLEIGLILVRPARSFLNSQSTENTRRERIGTAEIILEPTPYPIRRKSRMRKAIVKEATNRSADYNVGGSVRRPLITAYREQALHIACCLELCGDLTPKMMRALGTHPKTQSIVSRNVYGWFQRVSHGVYRLTEEGEIGLQTYQHVAAPYRDELQQTRQIAVSPLYPARIY